MMSGGVGLLIAAAVKVFVPEPKRKIKPDEDDDECPYEIEANKPLLECFNDLMKRPVSKYMTYSAALQQAIIMFCDYFYPLYFLSMFPTHKVEFSLIYGVSNILLGLPSVIIGGILAKKVGEKRWIRVCQASSLVPLPLTIFSLTSGNFWAAMMAMSSSYLICNLWWSPNMTLMQKTIDPMERGGAMSAYQFLITMVGCMGTITMGSLISGLGAGPKQIGMIIAAFISGAHFISVGFWQQARKH